MRRNSLNLRNSSVVNSKEPSSVSKLRSVQLISSFWLLIGLVLVNSGCNYAENAFAQRLFQPPSESDKLNNPEYNKLTIKLPDTALIDQEGRVFKFNSELLEGKTVAINFVYTTCGGICPLQQKNFEKVQKLLGDRLGKDIALISISKDPKTDTPEKMKAWSLNNNPLEGWKMVTGVPADVEQLLTTLIGNQRKGEHAPAILIIRKSKNVWNGLYGLEKPETVAEKLIELADI